MSELSANEQHIRIKPVVVIVDDEEEILISLRSLFRKSGYSLHLFTSGLEALGFLEVRKADVIISDMRMPEMNGSEFLEKSMAFSPDSIRIILSGYEEKSVILNTVDKGYARHYIMKPWNDEKLKGFVENAITLKENLHKKHLEKILREFATLPSPPETYRRLLEVLRKDPMSQKNIAVEIEKSPALVAKLLRMSNSIFFEIRKEVTTVFDALTFIGVEAVLNIVISLESFNSLYKGSNEDIVQRSEELRTKSVRCGQLARKIAGLWEGDINPHEAYIAGLMMDMGLLFRFSSSTDKFDQYLQLLNEDAGTPYEIDKQLFGTTHDEVGEALLTYWNFSKNIVSAVANHHSKTNGDPLTTIIQIADYLVQGENSLPHDPSIEKYAEELKPSLEKFIQEVKIEDVF